jgi:hypothetical protein
VESSPSADALPIGRRWAAIALLIYADSVVRLAKDVELVLLSRRLYQVPPLSPG